eukprot:9472471-Pyramimonas_sp.AAC.4
MRSEWSSLQCPCRALIPDCGLQVEWRDDKVMMPEPAPFHELFSPLLGQFDVDEVDHMEKYVKSAPVLNGRLVCKP